MSCVDKSFWDKDYSVAENSILKSNNKRWKEYGTLYWPSVTINQVSFRGDITAENILEVICAGLATKPDVCLNFYKEEHIVYEPPSVFNKANMASVELLVGVVILLVSINVLLICAYRRCQKKEMEDNLGIQVSSAVSHYIAVSQQNQNTSTSID